jgi:hypothetical protein
MSDYRQPPGQGSSDPHAEPPAGPEAVCTACRAPGLEPGFIEDAGEASQGYARWIAGPLERGLFGGASRMGRQRWIVEAWRCTTCGHLELYARSTT